MGYYSFSGLCRDKEFWPCVATVALCRDRFWLGTAFLCCDKESLVAIKPSGSMSRQVWLCLGFPVAIEFSQG